MAKLLVPLNTLAPVPWTETMPMSFGKYKGVLVGELVKADPSYLIWAHDNVKFFRLTDELYLQAQALATVQQRARMAALRDRYSTERANAGVGFIDLEREVRSMMAGTFGVHISDLESFCEGDWRDASNMSDEDDMDHWSNMRPY
jgi:hypothetical protein